MVVRADADLCCGAGQCAFVAPTVFELDDDGLVVVTNASPTGEELKLANEAVRDCPTSAITIEDA